MPQQLVQEEAPAEADESPGLPPDIVWLSTVKAAARLGVTPRTLYRFIDRGELPAYRFGRVIRLRLSDVDRYIEQCLVQPGSLEHLYPDGRPRQDQQDQADQQDHPEQPAHPGH